MGELMVKLSELLEMNMNDLRELNLVNFGEVVKLLGTYKSIKLWVKNTNGKIDNCEGLAQNAYQKLSKLGNSKDEMEVNKKAFESYVSEINDLEQIKTDLLDEMLKIERNVEIISTHWNLRADRL
jgi:hypothetical protein